MRSSYDVVVVGMGPAGSVAAYELARAGLSTLALEKAVHPRYKVCGGALSARIDAVLEPDFHSIVERSVHTVQFGYAGAVYHEVCSDRPIVYMTMRSRLDQHLAEKARQVGVTLHQSETVEDLRPVSDGIEVLTDQRSYHANIVIGADGPHSVVASRLFPKREAKKCPALEAEIDTKATSNYPGHHTLRIDFGSTAQGYGWIFPKAHGSSIGVVELFGRTGKPKEVFRRFLDHNDELVTSQTPAPLGHSIPVFSSSGWLGPAIPRQTLVQNRAVLIGDAGHLVDPLFGEGIYFAVRSAKLAATWIRQFIQDDQTDLCGYERAVEKEFGSDLRTAARLVRSIYAIPDWSHRVFGHPFPRPFRELLSLYCRLLQGEESYQSLREVSKHLVRRCVSLT